MQKQEAKRQFVQLDPIYKITNIKKAIYPRPLDDEDCAPEFVPIKMGQPRPELRKGQQSLFQPSLEGEPDYGRQYAFTFQLHEAVISKEKKKKLANEIKGLEIAALDGDATAQYVYASRLNTFRSFKDYLSKVDLQYKTANKWLAKSAKGGLANAQYELGRNMLLGRGCEVDMINGYK
jgi:TPR repeat protein